MSEKVHNLQVSFNYKQSKRFQRKWIATRPASKGTSVYA